MSESLAESKDYVGMKFFKRHDGLDVRQKTQDLKGLGSNSIPHKLKRKIFSLCLISWKR